MCFDTGHTAQSGIANDVGVAGVAVTAVDAAGTSLVGDDVAPSGAYSLAVVDPLNNKLRVTFATPAPYQPSAHGAANGTSVQFVDVTSGSAIANYAVNVPEDYAQDNPPIVTAIQYSGAVARATRSRTRRRSRRSRGRAQYTTRPTSPTGTTRSPHRTTLATVLQTGSIWGTAYDTVSDSMFAAATYKRHADLGPLGLGGIYRVSDVLTPAGAINPAATTTPWLDVTDARASMWERPRPTRDLGLPQDPSHDDDAFANAAKVGIGGLAVDPATHTLYFVNLFDKKVYSVDLDNPTGAVHSTSLGLTDRAASVGDRGPPRQAVRRLRRVRRGHSLGERGGSQPRVLRRLDTARHARTRNALDAGAPRPARLHARLGRSDGTARSPRPPLERVGRRLGYR